MVFTFNNGNAPVATSKELFIRGTYILSLVNTMRKPCLSFWGRGRGIKERETDLTYETVPYWNSKEMKDVQIRCVDINM